MLIADQPFSTIRLLLPKEEQNETKVDELRNSFPAQTLKGGLYFKGWIKKDQPEYPLVSVVTSERNGGAGLEETIESVLTQDYPNIELIIIDGNSSRETLDVIKKYEDYIDFWISEQDKGFYDGLNKGIPLANGEFINVLNADDLYIDKRTVSRFVRAFQEKNVDMVYSDTLILNKDKGYGHIRYAHLTRFHLANGGISQQSVFLRRSVYEKVGLFDLGFPIIADYEHLIRAVFVHKVRKFYLEGPMIIFSPGGLSTHSEDERMGVLVRYFKPWEIRLFRNRFFKKLFRETDAYYTLAPFEWFVRKIFHLWSGG